MSSVNPPSLHWQRDEEELKEDNEGKVKEDNESEEEKEKDE